MRRKGGREEGGGRGPCWWRLSVHWVATRHCVLGLQAHPTNSCSHTQPQQLSHYWISEPFRELLKHAESTPSSDLACRFWLSGSGMASSHLHVLRLLLQREHPEENCSGRLSGDKCKWDLKWKPRTTVHLEDLGYTTDWWEEGGSLGVSGRIWVRVALMV